MREDEIRPDALLARYLELTAEDAKHFFADAPREMVPCVACGSSSSTHQFEKNGFAYAQCSDCGTLFQSPRPSMAAFEEYYRQSESSRYWAEVFSPAVAEVRREKIIRPRVEELARLCEEKRIHVRRLIDVGAGHGIFLDEWRGRFPDVETVAVEPHESLAREWRSKGFTVVQEIVENVVGHDGSADLVTCFEVLEHVYDPLDFVRAIKGLARPGGCVFVTALGIDGFDLQLLWDKSSQISPPHHINLLSVLGFERLFERAGLVGVSITTPGMLDVDIVRNAGYRDPELLAAHPFLGKLLANDETAKAFQRFLSANRLSSHVWVLGRRAQEGESV